MKKRNMIKSIATFAAVSAGVLFAGSQSASASTVKHTVVSGDTLNKISAQYGVSVQDLAQANKIQDINKIYVGEVFTISDDGQVSVSDQSAVAAAPAQAATAPVAQAPVQQSAPAASSVSGSDAAAKDWIAGRESGGNYGAQNGQYVGKYQLSASYLNGDYSAANQERVADNYVTSRYGSWSGAQSFWQSHGWY
ncbi:LysM domain-containing protein [Fructilactobacillus sanfranciscensis]|uniref:aggregation-promoting factor n=1 Tax=Fructilactobacillus sanfranciscensis TaxID=1625 RepID=UPI0023AAE4A6|nr:LysM domain-containing protein [Fructilactobacillus sanfranciscensis]WED56972.1 LysM domain-containing protein [Fructilactobacillus sanfranciscensis]